MSVPYCEEFSIGGRTYGIEDYEKPGDHFFPENPHKRFRLWVAGGGCGQADTIEEARKLLHTYAVSQTNAECHGHQERMVSAQRTLQKLGDDPFKLGSFLIGRRL